MASTPSAHSRIQRGEETRRNILGIAVDIASRNGLDALSIGDLAKRLGMSKSGLFAHFGSKEDLQIAVIEAAEKIFGSAIIHPAMDAYEPGLGRLAALLEGYVRYLDGSVFSGGCFFMAAATEFDDRPGRVRDRIQLSMRKWSGMIEGEIRSAIEAGQIEPVVDPPQLAFELKAIAQHANFTKRLLNDEHAFKRARSGLREMLLRVATAAGREVVNEQSPRK